MTIDTTNQHLIARQGDSLVVLLPIEGRLTKQEALTIAAWLVVQADSDMGDGPEWKATLTAVLNC
jgi:hypothetical protein